MTNKNEKRKDEIATEMAVYFNEKVKTSKLAEWVSTTVQCCIDFQANKKPDNNPITFLHTIGWNILPGLIDSETQQERITVLKRELIRLYSYDLYEGSKAYLHELNCCYLRQVEKYDFDDGDKVYQHMNIYGTLLCILEIYKEYDTLERSLEQVAV